MTLNCAMILGGELPGGGICFASRRKIPRTVERKVHAGGSRRAFPRNCPLISPSPRILLPKFTSWRIEALVVIKTHSSLHVPTGH